MQINGKRRKDWTSALVTGALPSHAYSRSAVTEKKNKRLLSVYSFSKTDFTVGKRPVTQAKGKTRYIHLYMLRKRLSQSFSLPSGAHNPEQATRILGLPYYRKLMVHEIKVLEINAT